MEEKTKRLVEKVRLGGYEDAARYIENLTEEEKEEINFMRASERLQTAFIWSATPQGFDYWMEVAIQLQRQCIF